MSNPFEHYRLEPARSPEDWAAYHAIRRDTLFARLLPRHPYDKNDPDEFLPGHTSCVLRYRDAVIGVVRIDEIDAQRVGLRMIAVRDDVQRGGHGRAMLALAEEQARAEGRSEVIINAHLTAVGFYLKLGYAAGEWADPAPVPPGTIRVGKVL